MILRQKRNRQVHIDVGAAREGLSFVFFRTLAAE
jgi:hypothetical protein